MPLNNTYGSSATVPPTRSSMTDTMPTSVMFEVTNQPVSSWTELGMIPIVPPFTAAQATDFADCIQMDPSLFTAPLPPSLSYLQAIVDLVKGSLDEYEFGIQFTGYWLSVYHLQFAPGEETGGSFSATLTTSITESKSQDTSYEVGASVTFGAGGAGTLKMEGTISTTFGQTYSWATETSTETSVTVGVPNGTATETCWLDGWQRVSKFTAIYRKIAAAGQPENEWIPFGPEFENDTATFLHTVYPEGALAMP